MFPQLKSVSWRSEPPNLKLVLILSKWIHVLEPLQQSHYNLLLLLCCAVTTGTFALELFYTFNKSKHLVPLLNNLRMDFMTLSQSNFVFSFRIGSTYLHSICIIVGHPDLYDWLDSDVELPHMVMNCKLSEILMKRSLMQENVLKNGQRPPDIENGLNGPFNFKLSTWFQSCFLLLKNSLHE